jgi:predicted nuclease of predicted toxin-antitoxin system
VFLIDNNLPLDLATWLSGYSLAAQHVKALELDTSDDAAIWAYARSHKLAIITKDRDFDRFVADNPAGSIAVFRFSIGNATKTKLYDWLQTRVGTLEDYARSCIPGGAVTNGGLYLID